MGCTVHTSIAVHATCSAASSSAATKKNYKKKRLSPVSSLSTALRFPCLVSLRYGAQAVVISVDPRRVYVTSPEATARHTIKTVRLCTETGSNLAGLFWLGPTNRLVHSQFRPWEPGGSSFSLKDGVVVQNKQTNTKPASPLSNLTRFLNPVSTLACSTVDTCRCHQCRMPAGPTLRCTRTCATTTALP